MNNLKRLLSRVAQGAQRLSEEQDTKLSATAPDNITLWIVTFNESRLANDDPTHMPPVFYAPPAAKVGRNGQCPCGSGKKYKKCCAIN